MKRRMTMTTIAINNNAITLTTKKEISATDFFGAIVGSDFYGCTDYVVPRSLDVDENKLTISLKYYDVNNYDENGYWKTRTKTLTLKKLVTAFAELQNSNQTHCSGHSLDVDDYDGCFGYLVLQQAIYGELHF